MDFLELFGKISSSDTVISQSLVFQKNETARWGCFLQYNSKFGKSVNCQKKPCAAGTGVPKASTGFKMKTIIFNLYFDQIYVGNSTKTKDLHPPP